MNRINLFNQLLIDAKKENFYVGTGNPNARILIIGKELNIADINGKGKEQYQREVLNNISNWERDISLSQSNIRNWDGTNYSPLYPYKGQVLKIENKHKNNNGTSRTWYNYQKLSNLIFPNPKDLTLINFHENFFITELNADPSSTTKNAIKKTIKKRKEFIHNSEFFQSFPIVLLAGLGYFEVSQNYSEVESIFGVKLSSKMLADGRTSQPYWVHFNHDKSKLVINTKQLSNGISDKLLFDIASYLHFGISCKSSQE